MLTVCHQIHNFTNRVIQIRRIQEVVEDRRLLVHFVHVVEERLPERRRSRGAAAAAVDSLVLGPGARFYTLWGNI